MAADYSRIRGKYHSLAPKERSEAIAELARDTERAGDAARELIQLYHECNWRGSQQEILRALPSHPTQRVVEFLMGVALRTEDPVLSEAATLALGKTKTPLAAAFLAHFYSNAPEALRPVCASALALIPDRRCVSRFIEELRRALDPGQISTPKLLRHLVLALGELRSPEAEPLVRQLIDREIKASSQPALLHSALIAYGKLARTSEQLDLWESQLGSDPLEQQLLQSIRGQIQARSQWSLEDYLQRLFAETPPHPGIAIELQAYPASDLLEGVKLFKDDPSCQARWIPRVCLLLRHWDSATLPAAATALLDLSSVSAPEAGAILEALSSHPHSGVEPLLEKLAPLALSNPTDPTYTLWLNAIALGSTDPIARMRKLSTQTEFVALPDEAKIKLINALADHSLAVQPDGQKLSKAASLLAEWVSSTASDRLKGRALRALARLGYEDRSVLEFAKTSILRPELTSSVLSWLESVPSRSGLQLIAQSIQQATIRQNFGASALKALRAQERLIQEWPQAEAQIKDLLQSKPSEALAAEGLRLLTQHPLPGLLPWVQAQLSGKTPYLRLLAVIALKSYGQEATAELLAPLLDSPDRSLAGRALDTLTSLPGLRARRLAIDLLRDHPMDLDIADKVIRALQPAETHTPYFSQVLDQILEKHPQHPLWEGLVNLRDRLRPPAASPEALAAMGPEVGAVELAIRKTLPAYDQLDESVKTALRSAELPFAHPELFTDVVDKASSVLEFCKALDLQLEKSLGRSLLFPKLERQLHEFQTVLHSVGLDDESSSPAQVMRTLGVSEAFTVDAFPLHKMRLMAGTFFNGRIVQDRFRALDGLRAWAVVILLFARKLPGAAKAPLTLSGTTDGQLVTISRRLIVLQEIRNPAAHRQTYLKMAGIEEVRREVLDLIAIVQKWKS